MSLIDIKTNVVSDFVFIIMLALTVWILRFLVYRKHLTHAQRFFNFDRQESLRIFVSGFEHQGVKTKRVVNAVELESAIMFRETIKNIYEGGLLARIVRFLAGIVGIDDSYPEPKIEIAPLEKVSQTLPHKSLILLGGPVANELSSFYLSSFSPIFRFDEQTLTYQQAVGGIYQNVSSSSDLAIIEKIINKDQIVFLLHGYGEEQTARAVEYLVLQWRYLYRSHKTNAFAVKV